MAKCRFRNVLIILDLIGAPRCDVFAGIYRYARSKCRWNIRLLQPSLAADFDLRLSRELATNEFDGIITSCGGMTGLPEPLRHMRIPLVAMGVFARREKRLACPTVFLHPDDEAMGRFAAKCFAGLGAFRTYGYVAYPGSPYWSRLRSRGFAATLKEAGLKPHMFEAAPTTGLGTSDFIRTLSDWLLKLPMPTAVLCANDACATSLMDAAKSAKLRIPDKLAVIGIDNDELLCESASSTLTSISPGNGRIGERAAQELERMMKSRPHGGVKAILTEYHTLVERESTRAVSPVSHLIDRAQDFIRKNACSGITVPDVVAHLRISRRLADLRFSEYCNETIQEAITRTRLDCLCTKLSSTTLPIKSITHSCGFRNDTSAKHLFHRRFGMSMREWREQSKRTAH